MAGFSLQHSFLCQEINITWTPIPISFKNKLECLLSRNMGHSLASLKHMSVEFRLSNQLLSKNSSCNQTSKGLLHVFSGTLSCDGWQGLFFDGQISLAIIKCLKQWFKNQMLQNSLKAPFFFFLATRVDGRAMPRLVDLRFYYCSELRDYS